jgi:2'-5' RNA ligase
MTERCIMIFPRFSNVKIIDKIREKYDPLSNYVRPHITLVFPFISDIETNKLKHHLENVLVSVKPFRIILKDIEPVKSFGNYLFLNIEKGKEEIMDIHKKLYTGLLESYIPPWLSTGQYYPHMTLGNISCEEEYRLAMEATKSITDVFDTIVDKISVEVIDENKDSIIEMEIELEKLY